MKQALIVLFMIWFNLSHAQELPSCRVGKESGQVTLEFTTGSQKMVHLVGKEMDWTNPYIIRELCEAIRSEITEKSFEGMSGEMCRGLSSLRYKMIGFKMTEKGAELLKSDVIWFSPKGRFDGSQVNGDFAQVINENDIECSH